MGPGEPRRASARVPARSSSHVLLADPSVMARAGFARVCVILAPVSMVTRLTRARVVVDAVDTRGSVLASVIAAVVDVGGTARPRVAIRTVAMLLPALLVAAPSVVAEVLVLTRHLAVGFVVAVGAEQLACFALGRTWVWVVAHDGFEMFIRRTQGFVV